MDDYRSGFVSIIGRPNVGKSTLLNRIIGQKIAIMSDKPQTTRNKISGVYTREGVQIVFLDTPGIHKPKHKLGDFMVDVARRTLEQVDLVLYMVDASAVIGPGERYIMDLLSHVQTPVFLVINKIDLVSKDELLEVTVRWSQEMKFAEIIPVSAVEGENVQRLIDLIAGYLPLGPQYYPAEMVTDQPERFVIAELIREQALHLTTEEVPHSLAVEIEEVKKREADLIYVAAIIYTERDSQKGIIIGKRGQMLKEIGKRARREIENLLGSRVYLDLTVKVKKNWRKNELALRNLGYDRKNL